MTDTNARSVLPLELPLVGRSRDLEVLYRLFGTGDASDSVAVLSGETGMGKSRLVRTVAAEARRREWAVAFGRAYPVESGMPYALVSDAFLPLLEEMDEASLAVLTRGNAHELRRLFPALGSVEAGPEPGEDPGESRMRLYWNFAEFLKRLAGRRPQLVILEDLHWADPSSVSLLHFLSRQIEDQPLRFLATYNTDYRDQNESLLRAERSLSSLRRLRSHRLRPLSEEDTLELLRLTFQASGPPVVDFAAMLYEWTRGNPYFVEETLQALVRRGALYERDGTWLGWDSRELELPPTIRDAILVRLQELDPPQREILDVMAVVGSSTPLRLLEGVSERSPRELHGVVEALVRAGLVQESDEGGTITLHFRHPLVRETLYQGLGLARRKGLHGRVAEALERYWGSRAGEHADELAYHFTRGRTAGEGGDPRAVRYLASAGRAALERHADREAEAYLEAALRRLGAEPAGRTDEESLPDGRRPSAAADPVEPAQLKAELARARSRTGDHAGAIRIWRELLEAAEKASDRMGAVQAHRHLGLLAFWSGEHERAVEHYDRALERLAGAAPALEARIVMAAGVALQELGRTEETRERVERALRIAEELGHPGLLGRVHRALALFNTWIGESELARRHGWQAVELGDRCGDALVRFWGRWALASLEGMTGDTEEMARLMAQARGIADELGSPVLRLWCAELAIEYDWGLGNWDRALAVGERSIAMADALNQRNLLPRLLVWTAEIYLGRGDLERGREFIGRAWALAGLAGDREEARRGSRDVHVLIPVHIGMTALRIAEDRYDDAIEVGRAGLEIIDRTGYVFWSFHRLLPLVGEALIRAGRLDEANEIGERLRTESAAINHTLGLAWADACDAVVAWHSGEIERGAELLRAAAEGLEEIPIVPDAARIRRHLAARLRDLGDREGALAELRRVHEVFGRLGARPELEKTREQFRELDARPPSLSEAEGTADLTGREAEIARLVADRMSNKAIAKALSISPRTVSTHLTNLYRKVGVRSRHELADMVREGRLSVSDDGGPAE